MTVEILEHIDTEHVKSMIALTVYKEHKADVLVQRMVYDQFQQIIERMRRHIRGPAFSGGRE